jgi:dTMP kinase
MRFVAIEGLDGSGKSTQIGMLHKYFREHGIPFKYLHFPRTDAPIFGDLIARFLRGELGDIKQVDPHLVSLIYALDRYDAAASIQQWLADNMLVLVDRYVYSNIAFQCAKIISPEARKELSAWISHLEFDYFKLPRPALSVYLDVPFSFTAGNLTQARQGEDRGYLNGKMDIHESDLSFQEQVQQAYLWLVEEEKDCIKIDCSGKNNMMLSKEAIFDKMITIFREYNLI